MAVGNVRNDQPMCGRIGNRPYAILLVSVAIRAAHQVGGAVVLCAVLFDLSGSTVFPYLVLASVSGVLLVATEAMRHRQIYRETAGVSTAVKLALLGLAYHGYLAEGWAVPVAFVIAALAAHVPREIRHRLLY